MSTLAKSLERYKKYNESEKGHKRYLSYYHKNAAEINYRRSRRRLQNRILTKEERIAELERMLNNAQEN